MPGAAARPSPEEFRLLLLGRTPEPEAGRLESHLEGCNRCLGAVRTLRAEDALVEAVRGLRGARDRPEDEAVRALIERLQARPGTGGGAASEAEAPPLAPGAGAGPGFQGQGLAAVLSQVRQLAGPLPLDPG